MQKVKHILFFGLIAIMLASCASSKSASTKRQTLSQKAHVGLTVDQYQYNVDCVLKVWKNELIVLSVLPMMGIEMFRLEATPEDIIVIDKFNKRYAIITYEELQQLLQKKLTFKQMQTLAKQSDKNILIETQVGSHILKLDAKLSQPELNTLGEPQRINLKKYKQVTLRNILPI